MRWRFGASWVDRAEQQFRTPKGAAATASCFALLCNPVLNTANAAAIAKDNCVYRSRLAHSPWPSTLHAPGG